MNLLQAVEGLLAKIPLNGLKTPVSLGLIILAHILPPSPQLIFVKNLLEQVGIYAGTVALTHKGLKVVVSEDPAPCPK